MNTASCDKKALAKAASDFYNAVCDKITMCNPALQGMVSQALTDEQIEIVEMLWGEIQLNDSRAVDPMVRAIEESPQNVIALMELYTELFARYIEIDKLKACVPESSPANASDYFAKMKSPNLASVFKPA